jgi:hypothetical protein
MLRVVPSQVVALIEQLLPEVVSDVPFSLKSTSAETTWTLLALVDGVYLASIKESEGI